MSKTKQHEQHENIVKLAAEIGANAALEKLAKEQRKAQAQKVDRRLRNTKLLLRNYRLFKEHCDNAVYEIEQAESSDVDILELMDNHYGDSVQYVDSIKASVDRTATIVRHIKAMLDLYETYCYKFGTLEDQRRCRIVKAVYIDDECKSMSEISEIYHVSERTIYNDINIASERIACLLFGIDGLRKD